ncbi:MAG: hypothetical protein WD077_08115 [Bacteroidia bacterium]
MKNLLLIFVVLNGLLISSSTKSQVFISEDFDKDQLKGGTTYVLMNDPEAPASQPFIAIYKKYWTLSPIDFIRYDEIINYMEPNNTFLGLQWYATSSELSGSTHLYLSLWKPEDQNLNKKPRKIADIEVQELAHIEIFPDRHLLINNTDVFKMEYHGEDHLRNWGPGFLKNQLQMLTKYLEIGEERKLYEETSNAEALKELKGQTLYIPEYSLLKWGSFSGTERKRSESELMGKYEYNYKVLSNEDLNEMILNSDQSFYYLVYVKGSTDKFVTVINSGNGEIIYHVYTPASYAVDAKDIKSLLKEIK